MAFNKNKVMDTARKYVEKGQVDRAIKEYLRVVGEDPKDVRVWLKVGDLYAKKGAKQDATETYLKVAKFYSEQGFYLKAVAVYKQILKLDPRLVEVNLKLAELYRQLGLLSDAMQHFEMVAAHFHREGKTTEALATVRQLVDLDPDNVATRIKLAELYSKEEMIEEAVTEFRHACDFLRSHSRQDDFIKVAERLLWHKPDAHDLNRELATLYLRRNDPRRALQKLQACFKADPRDVETLALLAQAFQSLDQKPKTVSVLKELARVLQEDGQKEQCADVHRKILMYVPDDDDSLAYLGKSKPKPKPQPQPKPAAQAPAAAPASPRRPSEPRLRSPAHARVSPPAGVPRGVPAVGSSAHPARGFAITNSDLPDRRATNATGSVALVEPAQPRASFGRSLPTDDFAELALEESADFDTGTAAGEVHEEEIVKILTETDVYVKYGLHQKAIDHLRRVFELDPGNIEARARLKDILVSQGRDEEAVAELMLLAEQAGMSDRIQAEVYIREILAIDGTYQPAFELAEQCGLDLSGGADVEIVEDLSDAIEVGSGEYGTVEAVEDDIDFADIGFEDEELLVDDAVPVVAPDYETADDYSAEAAFEFSLDEIDESEHEPVAQDPSAVTQEVSLEQVEDMVPIDDADEDLAFDATGTDQHDVADFSFEDAQAFDADLAAVDEFSFDAPNIPAAEVSEFDAPARPADEFSFDGEGGFDDLDDVGGFDAPGGASTDEGDEDFGYAEVSVAHDEYPPDAPAAGEDEFSFDDVEAFPADDESIGGGFGIEISDDSAFEADAAPTFDVDPDALPDFDSLDEAAMVDPEQIEPFVEFGAEAELGDDAVVDAHTFDAEPIADVGRMQSDFGAPRPEPEASYGYPEAEQTVDGDYEMVGDEAGQEGGGGSLEDDLDEADFFVAQGLYSEARDILEVLLQRYPNHPLVMAKLQDVDAMEEVSSGRRPSEMEPPALDETEDLVAGLDDALSTIEEEPPGRPSVMLEKPVADEDADTHYDLGLAYKEMGLYGEAIQAFEKVSSVAGRAVQCHLMIGLCHREQRNLSEAIHQFKTGLHESEITDREKLSLYYEIGSCYEDLNDPAEALYYLEMINKKDPGYRDVGERLDRIKSAAGKNGDSDTRRLRPAPDDTDAAIEMAIDGDEDHRKRVK